MKKIMAFVAALVALSVSGFGQTVPASAGTVITNGITLAMGSTNKVFDYLVRECNVTYLTLKQGGQVKARAPKSTQADSLAGWAHAAVTNMDTIVRDNLTITNWLDPNQKFSMTATAVVEWDEWEPPTYGFWGQVDFFLVKDQFGAYHVPESAETGLNFNLDRQIPVAYVPNGSWARIEVADRNGNRVDEDDNFINPNDVWNGLISFDGPYLTVRTLYACSGDTGPYVVKVILVTDNRYMVFDGNGNQVPETPIALSLQRESGGLKISVTGGDTYRMFSLQKSTDMKNWNTIATGMVPAHSVPWTFTDTSTVGNGFYRVLTVENQALRVALKSALK